MRGYKVFGPAWMCNGKQYACQGEYVLTGKLEFRRNGINFCRKLSDCFSYFSFIPRAKVAEIEALGDVLGADEKVSCTNWMRIVRELPWSEVLNKVNDGPRNSGYGNKGKSNSGSNNVGHCNKGFKNMGSNNAGSNNVGDNNAGSNNRGSWNAGNWNATDFSSGCFNTESETVRMFNKDSGMTFHEWWKSEAWNVLRNMPPLMDWVSDYDMTEEEKAAHPEHATTGGCLRTDQESKRQEWWDKLREEKRKAVTNLPNFDPEIFKACTGIDVKKTKSE